MEEKEEVQVSVRDYLRVLRRGWWILIGSFLLVLALSIFLTSRMPRIYEARTTVIVKTGRESIFPLEIRSIPDYSRLTAINNHVEILKSSSLAMSVAQTLRLDPSTQSFGILKTKSVEQRTLESIAQAVKRSISVAPVRGTDLIEIRARAESPKEAMVLANKVAETFLGENIKESRGEVREVKGFLEEQVGTVGMRLREEEEKLKKFQESEHVVSLPEETKAAIEQLARFEGLYNEALTDLQAGKKKLAYLEKQLSDQKSTLVEDISKVTSPLMVSLRQELASLEAIRAKLLSQGYSDKHEKMVEVDGRIKETKRKLIDSTKELLSGKLPPSDPLSFSQGLVDRILELNAETETFQARADALKKVVDRYGAKLTQIPEKNLELARLERARKVDEAILTMLMSKYEEARISEVGEIGDIRILDRARAPKSPISPKKKKNALVGGFLGLVMGVSLSFLSNYLRSTLHDEEDIRRVTTVPILGTVPLIRSSSSRKERRKTGQVEKEVSDESKEEGVREIERKLVLRFEPWSPIPEAYRGLRTYLQFASVDDPPKVIVMTSPAPSEGKSLTVANLAIVLAQAGNRVILVDADMRRPMLEKFFGTTKGWGVTDILRGAATVEEAIRPLEIENLYLLGVGPIPPNPSEILGSKKMRELVAYLKDRFDLVLLDSPPMTLVTDPTVLSAISDGTLLVVRIGKTTRGGLERAVSLLRSVRANILGLIANGVETRRRYGRYRYYEYGGYKYRPRAEDKKLSDPDKEEKIIKLGSRTAD